VKTTGHEDGQVKVLEGKIDLPADVDYGMIFAVTKNFPEGAPETVHCVASRPDRGSSSFTSLRRTIKRCEPQASRPC